MPKRVGFLYDKITSWQNLYLAYRKACRHKKRKAETAEWMFNCEKYLLELQQELVEHSYQPQPYRYFSIKEPKERIISVAAFRDRVVHHALVNVIEPYFESVFIKDSYATRKEKGLHLAVKAAQGYMRGNEWYLKMDIRKYFDSIDHEILMCRISRKIKDPEVLNLCRIILKNQTLSSGLQQGKGLPVGNLTSQFFANIYLNPMDHFIKQHLGYKAYVRYMDDFVLFSDDPQKLKETLKRLENYLQLVALQIKPKSIQINRCVNGLPFLGYRIYPNLIRIRQENLKRCLRGIVKTEQAYLKNQISAETLYQSTKSRMGFIGFANSFSLSQAIWGMGL